MSNQDAHKLRQEGKYQEAIVLYEKDWAENKNEFSGAGLINCLRKLKEYDEALKVAIELMPIVEKKSDFNWGRIEIIWALIQGKLNNVPEDAPLDTVLEIAGQIMNYKPEDVSRKVVVFQVIKAAKAAGKWDVVNDWADKLDPEKLDIKPIENSKGRDGWSDQVRWYNYKCTALVKQGKSDEVFSIIEDAINRFPKQRKFLLRLKALANHNIGELERAEEIYKDICNVSRPDWWIKHEYANVLNDKGDLEGALKLMCQAALSNNKLDVMVTMLKEIGLLLKEISENDFARVHLTLASLVRHERGWSIPEIVTDSLKELNAIIGDENAPQTIREAMSFCRPVWEKYAGDIQTKHKDKRKPKMGMVGKISIGKPENPFCFIADENKESYFCYKSNLPEGAHNGMMVCFKAIPSFDNKKNKESWKAVDIKKQ